MAKQQDILKVAINLAKDAGPMFRTSFGKPKNIQIKEGGFRNFVTEVDLAIEQKLRRAIIKEFPDHGVIGEEMESHSHKNQAEYTWILDPIDGTTNYIHGMPYCCISIGVFKNHKPFVGVIYNPVLDILYIAQKGKGARKNGKKISVSKARGLKFSYGTAGWGKDVEAGSILLRALIYESKFRVLGSHALSMCEVASGMYDYFVDGGSTANIWDVAAAQLIVSEAGGITTDISGNQLHGFHPLNNVISAATLSLHKQLVGFLTNRSVS